MHTCPHPRTHAHTHAHTQTPPSSLSLSLSLSPRPSVQWQARRCRRKRNPTSRRFLPKGLLLLTCKNHMLLNQNRPLTRSLACTLCLFRRNSLSQLLAGQFGKGSVLRTDDTVQLTVDGHTATVHLTTLVREIPSHTRTNTHVQQRHSCTTTHVRTHPHAHTHTLSLSRPLDLPLSRPLSPSLSRPLSTSPSI